MYSFTHFGFNAVACGCVDFHNALQTWHQSSRLWTSTGEVWRGGVVNGQRVSNSEFRVRIWIFCYFLHKKSTHICIDGHTELVALRSMFNVNIYSFQTQTMNDALSFLVLVSISQIWISIPIVACMNVHRNAVYKWSDSLGRCSNITVVNEHLH